MKISLNKSTPNRIKTKKITTGYAENQLGKHLERS